MQVIQKVALVGMALVAGCSREQGAASDLSDTRSISGGGCRSTPVLPVATSTGIGGRAVYECEPSVFHRKVLTWLARDGVPLPETETSSPCFGGESAAITTASSTDALDGAGTWQSGTQIWWGISPTCDTLLNHSIETYSDELVR